MSSRGLFISVEGIDGAGKSTHVEFIKNYLIQKGKSVIITREPGGTTTGEKIRDLLLNSKELHANTELMLMFASRQELIKNVIIPNLSAGVSVLTDRFIDASIAYQGAGRQIGDKKIKQMINMLEPAIMTDLTILFDVPVEVATARLNKHINKDRIENEDHNFFKRVRNAYHKLAIESPDRVKIVDSSGDVAITIAKITEILDTLLAK